MWENIDSVYDTATTISSTTAAPGVVHKHTLAEVDDIVGTGKTISSMLIGCLTRLGSTDTYTGKAYLLESDFHIRFNALGSRQEYVK